MTNPLRFIKRITFSFLFLFSTYSHAETAAPWLANYQYPYPVHYFKVMVEDQPEQIAYMQVKPADWNGQTILLLHGKNFFAAYWQTPIAALTQAGYQVIATDQLGFGKSSKPAHIDYTLQLFGSITAALLQHLQITHVIVLGHSMGGMAAIRFALMNPQMTDKLILEDPLGLEDYRLLIPYVSVDTLHSAFEQSTPQTMAAYQHHYFYKWQDSYNVWAETQGQMLTAADASNLAWISALTSEMIYTQPVVYELAQLKMPVLIIEGAADRTAPLKQYASPQNRLLLGNMPALGQHAATVIPHAQVVIIPQAGHIPHLEAFPTFISAVLSFLSASS